MNGHFLQAGNHRASKPIRVLHFFRRMDRGGAELRTMDILRRIDRDRYRLDFCTHNGLPGELDDEIRALGSEVYPCPLGPSFHFRFPALLRKHGFDVVHAHTFYFSGYILKLAARVNVPVRVAHFRTSSDGRGNGWRRRLQRAWMKRSIERYATHILAVSRSVLDAAWTTGRMGIDPRCRVVYSGPDVSRFQNNGRRDYFLRTLGIPRDSKICLHVGNMSPAKNHLRLISMFYRLAERMPDVRLVLIGRVGNALEGEIRKKIRSLGLDGKVFLLGSRSDIPAWMNAADILLFPSLREGLPGAVLEACAAGTPVLASDLPGIREISEHFRSVKTLPLSEPDDRWAAEAERILRASPNGPLRESAGEAFARSPFSLDACIEAHCSVWDSGVNEVCRPNRSHDLPFARNDLTRLPKSR